MSLGRREAGDPMGTVINFSGLLRAARSKKCFVQKSESEPATIIILPVIRVERHTETPENHVQPAVGGSPRRRRRTRATR
jgi:hypothetical protein